MAEPEERNEYQIARLLKAAGVRPSPDAAVTAGVRAEVHAAWQKTQSQHYRRRYLAAAAVILAVTFGWVVSTPAPVPTSLVVAQVIGQAEYQIADGPWRAMVPGDTLAASTIRTGTDSYVSWITDGGASMRLAPGSQLSVTTARAVSLDRGAVYIDADVADLIIATPFGTVRDVGTRFEVHVDTDTWRVQVRDGMVEVRNDGLQEVGNAGDRISMTRNNQVQRSRVAKDDRSWTWTEAVAPSFQMEGATLADYLAWHSHETGQRLQFVSEGAARDARRTILHGSIAGLTPSESLPVVLSTTRFHQAASEPGNIAIDK
jgi:hypothetical protein